MTTFNVTQAGLEVWVVNSPKLLTTQVGLEVWAANTPDARVTQVGLEVWRSTSDSGTSFVVTQVGLEVWEFIPYVPPPQVGVIVLIMGG